MGAVDHCAVHRVHGTAKALMDQHHVMELGHTTVEAPEVHRVLHADPVSGTNIFAVSKERISFLTVSSMTLPSVDRDGAHFGTLIKRLTACGLCLCIRSTSEVRNPVHLRMYKNGT